jgi:hypothetical protein
MAVRGSLWAYVSGFLLVLALVAGLGISVFESTRARQAILGVCTRLSIQTKCVGVVDKMKNLASRAATTFSRRTEPQIPVEVIDENVVNSRLTFLDRVDLYQKAGLVEVYGGTLSQRRNGPIRVDATVLNCDRPYCILAWSPDVTEAANIDTILVELSAETTNVGRVSIGAELADGRVFVWEARLGANQRVDPPSASGGDESPNSLHSKLHSAPPLPLAGKSDRHLAGSVPVELRAALSNGNPLHHIRRWILEAAGMTGSTLAVSNVAFVKSTEDHFATAGFRTLSGQIRGIVPDLGSSVKMILDDGQRQETTLSFDNTFLFTKVPKGHPVSLRYTFKGVDYYADFGRWFWPTSDETHVEIKVGPEFPNPTGSPPDPKSVKIDGGFATVDGVPSYYRYAPHQLTNWPGAGPVQEFRGVSFANNFGQLDRDRAFQNSEHCLRIFVVGGSGFVALQVKPGEKFNIVAESELGIDLGRCVEVISGGRDNGNVAANYRLIRDYGMKFNPDIVIFEHNGAYAAQLNATLLKKSLGYDYAHNALDNFYFDKEGQLVFRNWDPVWPLDAVAPDSSPLIPNVPFGQTFWIPRPDFVPEAKDSFDLLIALVRKLKADYPKTRFAMITALDQANCRHMVGCEGEVTLPDKRVVPMSIAQLMENFDSLCKDAGIDCIQAPIPGPATSAEEGLQYTSDAHFSIRGHQWLGNILAKGIEEVIRKWEIRQDGSRTSPNALSYSSH